MRKLSIILFAAMVAASAWAQAVPDGLVFVEGGAFKNKKSNYYGKSAVPNSYIGKEVTVASFYIGKYEVTQREWVVVMGANPSKFQGDNLPVETVSWYDCIQYCNQRSLKEGLKPCYTIDRNRKDTDNTNEIDDLKWTVTINAGADGYRLPT